MCSTTIQEEQAGAKVVIGSIVTQRPITGSRINECGIVEIALDKNSNDSDFIRWLIGIKMWIEGSPRFQQVWDVRNIAQRGNLVILTQVVLRPDGLCVACAGTGKYQASRHKATAKCPSCKGRGFVTGVWPEEPKKEDEPKNDGSTEGTQTGSVVAHSQDAPAADSSSDSGSEGGQRREEGQGD